MVQDPGRLDGRRMEARAGQFDSWDVTDRCSMNLFEKLQAAWVKANEWSGAGGEFVKRAGIGFMARLGPLQIST